MYESKMKKLIFKIIRKLYYYLKLPIIDFSENIILYLKPTKINCKMKTILLRMRGSKIGKNLFLDRSVWINSPKKLILGNDVVISKDVVITTGGLVNIGNRVLIGYGTKILSANHRIPNNLSEPIRFSGHDFKKVNINDDVWIGANVVILPGVTIGKNSVIAAGAVVTKDIQSNVIVGGVPAKLLKKRT